MKFKDHFSSDSAGYAAYRPSYPLKLIDELARISPSQERVLDCACGTGQLSVLLAERFREVIATDASAAQIGKAQARDGVTYRTALAEESGLPSDNVDLITVAQAAHWLDLEKFYAEAKRIARSKAVLALISYGVLHLEDDDSERVVQEFYHQTIAPYWPPERRHVEDGYRALPFPFREVTLAPLSIEADWSLNDLLGYINTWSAVKAAEKGLGVNPAAALADQLRKYWRDGTRQHVQWPLSIRAGVIRE